MSKSKTTFRRPLISDDHTQSYHICFASQSRVKISALSAVNFWLHAKNLRKDQLREMRSSGGTKPVALAT